MGEEIVSVGIVGVGVGITSDKVGGFWIFGLGFFKMVSQFSKCGEELVILASSREIDCCVEGGNSFRHLEQNCLEARGLRGDNRDEGGEGAVPHYHGATSGLDLVQGEVLVMRVLRVEVCIIVAKEGSEVEMEITTVDHRLTEEDQGGFVLLSNIS